MKKKIFFLTAFIAATVMNLQAGYYIAGNGSATNNWCCGINWQADGCAMTAGSYSTKVPAGTYEFKITEGDWAVSYGYSSVDASASTPGYEGSDNVKFIVAAEANINVTFDGMYIVLTSDVPFGGVNVTSWTIAGDEILLGSKWDPADTNNDMELVGGAYQLVKNVYLTEGGYDYKACANHAWSIKEVPSSGNNTLQIDADGDYEVTFSMDAQGTTLSAVAELDTEMTSTITAQVNDTNMGSVTGAGEYDDYSNVTLTAVPKPGYKFVNWTGDKTGTANPFTFSIANKDVTVQANFEKLPAKITLAFNMQGHGEPVEPQTIVSGSKFEKPDDPQAQELTFTNWYTEAECTHRFDFNKSVSATKDTTITLYAYWRDQTKYDKFLEDLMENSYVEYDTTYKVGFKMHLATKPNEPVELDSVLQLFETSASVAEYLYMPSLSVLFLKEYPMAIDEISKCTEITNVAKLLANYTTLPVRNTKKNAIFMLFSYAADIIYKNWAETNYTNDVEICKCFLNSDVFFKQQVRIMEAFQDSVSK